MSKSRFQQCVRHARSNNQETFGFTTCKGDMYDYILNSSSRYVRSSISWSEQLKRWKNGHPLTYDRSIVRSPFFYETSPVSFGGHETYRARTIQTREFDKLHQNYSSFKEHFGRAQISHFWNKSSTAYLIVPRPDKGRCYLSIKHFIDAAPIQKQVMFWKEVSKQVSRLLRKYPKLWVSTHGTGVHYFHLRVDLSPKYYHSRDLKRL